MAKKESVAFLPKPTNRVYTDAELKEFDQQLDKYKRWVEITREGVTKKIFALMSDGEKRFMIDEGAWNKDGAVILKNVVYNKEGSITSYDAKDSILADKLRQRTNWKGRMEYGERQRLLQLQSSM